MRAIAIGVVCVALGWPCALAASPRASEEKDFGLAAGPMFPMGSISEAYGLGFFTTLRGYYFPGASPHGVRAGLWLGAADGKTGVENGFGYGGEMDYARRFGSGPNPVYLFVGGGFCGSDFVAVQGSFPGGTQITIKGSGLYAHVGVGYAWKRMFVETSYVEVFDDDKNYGFLPVVIGVRFEVSGSAWRALFSSRRARSIRERFAGRVDPEALEALIADPGGLRLDGERRELTVLFCDLRGFAALAEAIPPEDVARLLNGHLGAMSEAVLAHGGTVDKFMGDSVMALFGAPVARENHAARACAAALAMQRAVVAANRLPRDADRPPLAIGIGINTGTMAAGNMGTAALFDYTVIGQEVALGARFAQSTASYGVSILAGERTESAARSAFTFREIDTARVEGRKDAVRIFEVHGDAAARATDKAFLLTFADALQAFREGDRERARDLFAQAERLRPGDGPCRLYLTRCG